MTKTKSLNDSKSKSSTPSLPNILILGGMRIGDTIMATPGIRSLAKQIGYIDLWIHGTFTNSLCAFFKETNLPVKEYRSFPERRIPQDITDIEDFSLKASSSISNQDANIILFNKRLWASEPIPHATYQWAASIGAPTTNLKPPHFKLKNHKPQSLGYICVQPDSLSYWKRLEMLYRFTFPLPVHTVGLPGERLIPGSIDALSNSFLKTTKTILNCTLFIGIGSALVHLAAALGKPSIMCHFESGWNKHAGISSRGKNLIDLVTPTHNQLTDAINTLLTSTKLNDTQSKTK